MVTCTGGKGAEGKKQETKAQFEFYFCSFFFQKFYQSIQVLDLKDKSLQKLY